ncbi:MAG: Membrane protein insertion efficiency factor YidD, partial [uncultured Solirubrobacteraceae bacterium]
ERRRAHRRRPHPALPAPALAAASAVLPVPPQLLGVRRAGDRAVWHPQGCRARRLAPAAMQSLELGRSRSRRGPDPLPPAPGTRRALSLPGRL